PVEGPSAAALIGVVPAAVPPPHEATVLVRPRSGTRRLVIAGALIAVGIAAFAVARAMRSSSEPDTEGASAPDVPAPAPAAPAARARAARVRGAGSRPGSASRGLGDAARGGRGGDRGWRQRRAPGPREGGSRSGSGR